MINPLQKTINSKVSCVGVGIHSGQQASITIYPADCDSGITFCRTDVDIRQSIIKADYKNVATTNLGTTIANEFGVKVSTIEHLMAAIWGCDIDNLYIEINGSEIPIMDGSSWPFVFLIECAGIIEQEKPRNFLEITDNFEIYDDDKFIKISPSRELVIDLEIDFNHQKIKHQSFSFNPNCNSFKNDICRARTFGFKSDVERMHKMGLGKGGSLNNAIIIDDEGIINDEGLRYNNELARHKTLDFIGDIFLCGYHIIGKFHTHKSGHSLNNKMLHQLFLDKTKWRII